MSHDAHTLKQLLEPTVQGLGYELFGIELLGSRRQRLLRIYIDREDGIDVEDCARVSQQVSALLDVEDPIGDSYTLEVSSPGLDRPLFEAEHFERFAGEQVRLQLDGLLEGRRKILGRLLGVQDDQVMVQVDGETWRVPLARIDKARLVPGF
jgi:ribosome maturation factor RimP